MSSPRQGIAFPQSAGARHRPAAHPHLLVLACLLAPLAACSIGAPKPTPTPAIDPDFDPQTALMTVVEPGLELSTSPLDDSFDPATGTVTFAATDISLPGNFDIPVELSRWVPSQDMDTGGPGHWKWNLPLIRGNYLDVKSGHSDAGWDWGYNTWRHGKNCSGSADTVINNHGDAITADAYWDGKLLHIPGVTSETFVTNASSQQVTRSNFRIVSCISNPGGQEGIVVAGPDGLTYTFNQIKSYYNGKPALKDPVVYTRLLMVTKIEDRFGNRVDYSYTGGKLTQISATDGRQISISYSGANATATANGRTWSYTGDNVTMPGGLDQWQYTGLTHVEFDPSGVGGYNQQLRLAAGSPYVIPGCTVATGDYTVQVTSPAGLLSTYVFRDTIHYRANVEPFLYYDIYATDFAVTRSLACTNARSLVSKTISGPGISATNWTYQYSGNRGTYTASSGINPHLTGPFDLPVPAVGGYPSPISTPTAVNYRSTTVAGPDRRIVFYIDRKADTATESRVIAQDILNPAGTELLSRSEYGFALGHFVGNHYLYQPVNDYQRSYRINQTQTVEKRYVGTVADSFTTTFSNFDAYDFPLSSQGSNSFSANVRTVARTYLHDTVNSLIGLPLTETVNGTTVFEHHYDSLGRRDWSKHFGQLRQTLTWNANGTLNTVKDGNNKITTLSSWKRGIPQSIQYPATAESPSGAIRAATVDDNGWITSLTNEHSDRTCYAYDPMGRISQITYPSEAAANTCNTSTWNATTQVFEPVNTVEHGIAAGHWRQTVSTGNGRKVTYFDGLWRPLIVHEYDTAAAAATARYRRFEYGFDAFGTVTFASYPAATLAAATTGQWRSNDSLGRLRGQVQSSELGSLSTQHHYLTGFQTRLTDPKGNQTTTSYLAHGEPSYEFPVTIAHPASAWTHITRDVFGKPTKIRRSNSSSPTGGTGVDRTYTYDAYQQLCRSVEPETGATLLGYDGAGNVKWSAAGLPSGQACEASGTSGTVAARRVDRTWDGRNRLTTLAFPDGKGNQAWTYTPDGLPASIATNNTSGGNTVTNSYAYNRRRLPTQETLVADASNTWTLGYGYNANGHLSSESYPAGLTVAYTLNALGQPTQVSAQDVATVNVASSISYFPNGAVKQFTYGNGMVHTATQNTRGLPSRLTDCTASGTCASANRRLDLEYAYDANGNTGAITDQVTGAKQTRAMTYDARDRLTQTTSSMFGTAGYGYDALDNLTTVNVSGGSSIRNHHYCYSNNRLATVRTGSCSGSIVQSLTYDVQGNLTSKGSQTFSFDYGNRLREISGIANYLYDGHGLRVRSTSSGTTPYIYGMYDQGGKLRWQRDEVANQRLRHIYLGNRLLAEHRKPIGTNTETIEYLHVDALGSPIARTNSSKTTIQSSEHEPYGLMVNRANDNRPGFTGHVMDAGSGLTYMQQRYYWPEGGVFLSVDPVRVYGTPTGAFNRYWYANSNPYKFTDPDGRFASDDKNEDNLLPPEPITLPTVPGTAPRPSPPPTTTEATVVVIGMRLEPIAWGAIGDSVGGFILTWGPRAGPLLFFVSPHPCGGEPCGELTMESRKYNPGFWPGDKGAEEWGRRNGVGAAEGRRRFHGIKQGDKGQGGGKGRDDYGTNPDTGEVQNPQGETVGDLNDG